MGEPIETFEHNGRTVEIHLDDDPSNPREWDNLSVMACWHSRYNLGDYADDDVREIKSMFEHLRNVGKMTQFPNYLRKHWGATVVLGLGLIDHSGISIYTVGENLIADPRQRLDGVHAHDSGGWDSGLVGFVFDTAASREMCGTPPERVEQCLRDEVSTYDDYLTGMVYGYVVTGEDGEDVDSCWDIFGSNYAEQSARDAAGYTCKHCERPLVRNVGPVLDDNPDPDGHGFLHNACESCGHSVAWGGDGWFHNEIKVWDWPGGKPDHEAKIGHTYRCPGRTTHGETDQTVGSYNE